MGYHGLLVLLSIYHHHHHHRHHRHLQVSLITCMMSADTPDTAGPDCWLQMELDYALVEECIADGLGDVLHAANGEETTGVANPPVTNVPWSNFDGEHLEGGEYWEIEEVGLLAFLCQKFTLAGCPAAD